MIKIMPTPTIETDLGKILEQINQNLAEFRKETNQRFESLNQEITNIKVELAEVKGDIKALQVNINTLKEDFREMKGSQKAQIWALIGIMGTAVLGTVIRFVITAIPPSIH